MSTKHTPGPWNVVNCTPSNALDIAVVFDAESQCVCSIPKGSSHTPMLERRANAILIAAAPDLLDCCKRALDAWTGDGPAIVLDDLRAAIAKATGGKP